MATIVDEQSRGFALGGTDFIAKPIDWDRLGVILRPHRSAQTSSPILVVDDDDATRSMTNRHLTAQGWHVVEASNGREALERLAGTRPAVILLDLMMPEMDGFQFVERLQRDETWRTIPVVVVTARYYCGRPSALEWIGPTDSSERGAYAGTIVERDPRSA